MRPGSACRLPESGQTHTQASLLARCHLAQALAPRQQATTAERQWYDQLFILYPAGLPVPTLCEPIGHFQCGTKRGSLAACYRSAKKRSWLFLRVWTVHVGFHQPQCTASSGFLPWCQQQSSLPRGCTPSEMAQCFHVNTAFWRVWSYQLDIVVSLLSSYSVRG